MWRPKLIILQPTPYCNINCKYCYLRHRDDFQIMSNNVVDAICEKVLANVASDAAPTIVWHGGEPTVVSLKWYRRSHEQLKAAAPPSAIFRMQSNGVALSDAWIDFLRDTDTRIGLSIDGPRRFHDARRRTRSGAGTWEQAMKGLRRLQLAGLEPNVVSVLHPDCLSAADEFYEFYKANEITNVSFSIDEMQGANLDSSFGIQDRKSDVAAFLVHLLNRAFSEEYPLHVRDIERIANILAGNANLDNEQLKAWQIVVVAANGDMTTFSPEFLELPSSDRNGFCFGNVLTDDFDRIFENERVSAVQNEIQQGIENCRARCDYFKICGGGAPVNKLAENATLASGETAFCRHSIQPAADALIEFLSSIGSRRPNRRLRTTYEDVTDSCLSQ
jgi:uncharacterized protein